MRKALFLLIASLSFLTVGGAPHISLADEYVLVMSKDNDVSQHMLKIFNEDLKESGEIQFDKHDEFTSIKWEEKRRYKINDKGEKDYDDILIRMTALYSKFDINNDGVDEIVFKTLRGLGGISSDNIYIFKEETVELFKYGFLNDNEIFEKAFAVLGFSDKPPFRGNGYSLKDLPPAEVIPKSGKKRNVEVPYAMGGWFYFQPFSYKGNYYVTMTDWQQDMVAKWLVILKLTPTNEVRDISYYLRAVSCENAKCNGR